MIFYRCILQEHRPAISRLPMNTDDFVKCEFCIHSMRGLVEERNINSDVLLMTTIVVSSLYFVTSWPFSAFPCFFFSFCFADFIRVSGRASFQSTFPPLYVELLTLQTLMSAAHQNPA